MKKSFSVAWKGSRQPRKQRKYLANAPKHIKHVIMSAHLSKELKAKYNRRSVPIKKGDVVKILIGEYKKKTGKVSIVDLMKMKVAIEGIQITKKDGTKINVFFHPSNLLVTELNLEDKQRTDSLKKENASIKTNSEIKPKHEVKK